MSEFSLDARLEKDCFELKDLPLCRLLMMNDTHYPWFILVPRRNDIRELYELSDEEQLQFQQESNALSRALMSVFGGDKLNIAALGNVVPQLHIHHIVRYIDDPAWPDPVWGKHPARAYSPGEAQNTIEKILQALG